jgi:uncharacterized protein
LGGGSRLSGDVLALPSPVVTEACYLLAREAGARAEAAFLGSLADLDLDRDDWRSAAELLVRYSDLPLGAVDASVVAVAERLGLTEIATIDDDTSAWSVRGASTSSPSCQADNRG